MSPDSLRALGAFLTRWEGHAPGACEALARACARAPETWRGERLALERLARKLGSVKDGALRAGVGRAYFPVVLERPEVPATCATGARGVAGVEGFLCQVVATDDDGRPPDWTRYEQVPGEVLERVKRWLLEQVGLQDGAAATTDGWGLFWQSPPEGVEIKGRSLEGAALAALVSALLGTEPKRPIVASATLGAGRAGGESWQPIDQGDVKRRVIELEVPSGAGDTRREALRWVVERPCDGGEALDAWFGRGWRGRLAARLEASSRTLVHEARQASSGNDWGRAQERASLVLEMPDACALDKARALVVLGELDLHRANARGALERLERADGLFERARSEAVKPTPWEDVRVHARLAVAQIDLLRPRDALALVEPARARLEKASAEHRGYGEWKQAWIEVMGTRSRAQWSLGDLDAALETRLALVRDETADVAEELARNQMELAELFRRRGELEQARGLLREAARHIRDIPYPRARDTTRRFLDLYELRAGVETPTAADEAPDWFRWPQPGVALEARIVGPPGALNAWIEAHWLGDTPPPVPVYYALALNACARAEQLHGASLPVAARVARRTLEVVAQPGREVQGPLDKLLRQTAEAGLASGALRDGWVRLCPY